MIPAIRRQLAYEAALSRGRRPLDMAVVGLVCAIGVVLAVAAGGWL